MLKFYMTDLLKKIFSGLFCILIVILGFNGYKNNRELSCFKSQFLTATMLNSDDNYYLGNFERGLLYNKNTNTFTSTYKNRNNKHIKEVILPGSFSIVFKKDSIWNKNVKNDVQLINNVLIMREIFNNEVFVKFIYLEQDVIKVLGTVMPVENISKMQNCLNCIHQKNFLELERICSDLLVGQNNDFKIKVKYQSEAQKETNLFSNDGKNIEKTSITNGKILRGASQGVWNGLNFENNLFAVSLPQQSDLKTKTTLENIGIKNTEKNNYNLFSYRVNNNKLNILHISDAKLAQYHLSAIKDYGFFFGIFSKISAFILNICITICKNSLLGLFLFFIIFSLLNTAFYLQEFKSEQIEKSKEIEESIIKSRITDVTQLNMEMMKLNEKYSSASNKSMIYGILSNLFYYYTVIYAIKYCTFFSEVEFLWFKNISMPEMFSIFNLYGLFKFEPSSMFNLGGLGLILLLVLIQNRLLQYFSKQGEMKWILSLVFLITLFFFVTKFSVVQILFTFGCEIYKSILKRSVLVENSNKIQII